MSIVLKTPDGKKVVVDISHDECLYSSPHNPPNTGTRYTAGTDLYAHRARSGTTYYYSPFWSMWQGTEAEFNLLTSDEMKELLVNHASDAGPGSMSTNEIATAEKHFPGIFDEDA